MHHSLTLYDKKNVKIIRFFFSFAENFKMANSNNPVVSTDDEDDEEVRFVPMTDPDSTKSSQISMPAISVSKKSSNLEKLTNYFF